MDNNLSDKIADVIAGMLCDLEDYAKGMLQSSLVTLVGGTAAFFLYWGFAPEAWPSIGFWSMLGLTFAARLVFGPSVVHFHPPLDAEERALLKRHDDGDDSFLKVVSDD